MMNALRITIFALTVMMAGMLTSNDAEALLPTHQCTFCHSLHGSSSTSSLVPLNSPTNLEVLCLGCHLTANGATDPVQPHRTGSGYAEFYVTCSDCHNIHDNMQNWRFGDPSHADGHADVTTGVNVKMIGTEDPDGLTPYAVIRTREKDFNKNSIPDRGDVTQTCDTAIVNDCYTQERRYVIFEQAFPASSLHAWVDADEDGLDPAVEIGPTDPTVLRSNESDSGALTTPDNKNWSAFDSLCQMCHTQTAKHNPLTGAQLDHNNTRACTDCHRHDICFDRGGGCAKWSVPNRDLQVDLVSAAPASVNGGDTVTITVDVTNLGDNVEDIEVRYSSSIEGTLGRSTATGVASLGSGQTSFNWVTTTAGTHTVTAKIVPVIGELVIANNSGTDSVTVAALDNHDVAVTLVTAPSPILQGSTEIVSVDIANPGTFTETFNVVLYDNTDDPGHASPIGTLSSGTMLASGTTTLNFNWNTTGASLGTHTLEAVADTAASETNTANNSATTTSTVAIHDVAVTLVTAPPSVDLGTTATVDVDIANLSSSGGFSETFNVTLVSDIDGTIGTLSSGALAAAGSTTLNFSWNTTGGTLGTHTLTATADTVAGETITANNTATTTSNVITPVTHDVAVDSVTAPATVTQGATAAVDVVVTNNGGAIETFDVTLSSNLDGTIQTLSSGALGIGASTTLNFSWVTGAGTTAGLHTLTAVAATVPSETNTADNTGSTTTTVQVHDVAVNTVTAPASTTQGNIAAVDVSITNQGDFSETFNVTLVSDLDGTIQTLSSGALGAGATTVLNFSWDTTASTIGTHTLTATAATVTGEFDTADNAASTTADVASAGPINDVAILSVTASPNPAGPTTGAGDVITFTVIVENQGTVSETIDVAVASDLEGATVCSITGVNLGAGVTSTTEFVCTWTVKSKNNAGTHLMTATATAVPGETDLADNTGTTTLVIN